jgi:6,7-dimethyl-8-ribityllumazine synthase
LAITYEKNVQGRGLRVAVVCARFNEVVTERLLQGALDGLRGCGVDDGSIEIARVPGAFEVPLVAEHFARSGRFDAVVCLGAIVRGETAHFDFISDFVVNETGRIMVSHGLPVSLGILTPNSVEQGLARAGGQHGNKGREAAEAAVEMANLVRAVRGEESSPR